MSAPRPRSSARQTALTYHCAAITHCSMLLPLTAAGAIAAFNVSCAIAAALMGQLALIGILPRIRAFRRAVDVRHERRAAAVLRTTVLGSMSPAHGFELDVLEGLAAGVRRRCASSHGEAAAQDASEDPSVERWLGLQRLLALYAELAVTHQGSATTFCDQDRAGLDHEVEQVRVLSLARGGTSDPWLERRRAVLARRRETWQRAAEERESLVHGLATIGGVIRWMHELCAVGVGDSVRAEVEDVLAAWESNGATLRELSGLRGHADLPAVDPRALALGREVVAETAARARREPHGTAPPLVNAPVRASVEPPAALYGAPPQACVAMPVSAAAAPRGGGRIVSVPHLGFVLRAGG